MSEEAVKAETAARSNRRTLQGVVKSNKMQKTILVSVVRDFKHPKYEKRVRRTKHYKVHDENGVARPGDIVEMMETRKMSKTKTWRLVRVVKSAE